LNSTKKITEIYRSVGVQEYYKTVGSEYVNPHKDFVYNCLDELNCTSSGTVLDLACGTGDVSKYFNPVSCVGSDKFLYKEYQTITGNNCYQYSFEDIADFNFDIKENIDLIVCSYAIDLVPSTYLNKLLYSLSTISTRMILIRPNSHIVPEQYWRVVQKVKHGKSRGVLYETY
jgi:SAM-dependent methyltransferase